MMHAATGAPVVVAGPSASVSFSQRYKVSDSDQKSGELTRADELQADVLTSPSGHTQAGLSEPLNHYYYSLIDTKYLKTP